MQYTQIVIHAISCEKNYYG